MILRLLGLIAVILFAIPLFADDDPQTPYPVEERCTDAPTLAQDDFSYSGRLLMTGYAGIHAMRADWETPRVEAFFNENELGVPIDGGQLSPDGRWYAVPVGEVFTEVSMNQYFFVRGLRIYSTVSDEEIVFDLYDYTSVLDGGYGIGAWTVELVRWFDNEGLIIGGFKIHPFDKTVEQSPIMSYQTAGDSFEISPDWSRLFGQLQIPQTEDSEIAPLIVISNVGASAVAWSHDSSQFIAYRKTPKSSLTLFDRDGQLIELVYIPQTASFDIGRRIAGRNELGWSPDDGYFAFLDSAYPIPPKLIILDTKDKITINTCLEVVSDAVWSPDGTQLATLVQGKTDVQIVILDLATWEAYIVGYHSGNMLAWIDDD